MLLSVVSSYAQFDGNAYYRIENVGVKQSLYLVSDFIRDIDYSQGTVDLPNLRGVLNTEEQFSKPSTVFYSSNVLKEFDKHYTKK